MNKTNRKRLKDAKLYLDCASEIINGVYIDESFKLDNVPENLQSGEAYDRREEIVDYLSDAVDNVSEASNNLFEVMS